MTETIRDVRLVGVAAGCEHCWHEYGMSSGAISGSHAHAVIRERCCHCGGHRTTDIETKHAPLEPKRHGRYAPL